MLVLNLKVRSKIGLDSTNQISTMNDVASKPLHMFTLSKGIGVQFWFWNLTRTKNVHKERSMTKRISIKM